jgi:hypothetical protein
MENKVSLLVAECDCGCGIIRFTDYKDDGDFLIEYYISNFYGKQDGVFKTIWNRIKFAYYVLTGREYDLYDVLLTDKKAQEFKKNLKKFVNTDGFIK